MSSGQLRSDPTAATNVLELSIVEIVAALHAEVMNEVPAREVVDAMESCGIDSMRSEEAVSGPRGA